MAVDVQLDQGAMKQLALSPEIQAVVLAKANEGKAIAEGLASDFRKTGEYQDSFNVRPTVANLRIGARAAAILENTSDHALAVEWGNSHDHQAHHVLGRTMDLLAGG